MKIDRADLRLTVGEVGDGPQGFKGHAGLGHPLVALRLLVELVHQQDGLACATGVQQAFHVDQVEADAIGEAALLGELRQAGSEGDVGGLVAEAREVEHRLLLVAVASDSLFRDGRTGGTVSVTWQEVERLDERAGFIRHADRQ